MFVATPENVVVIAGDFLPGGNMKFRIACAIALILMTIPTTGFVCASRVEKMEADIQALQLQFNEVQKRMNNDQTQLTEMILRADKKLEELGSAQNQNQDQVSQQNVQMALELEQERAELAAMRGRLDVQQRSLEELQASLQSVMGSVAGSTGGGIILPTDQEALYQFIQDKKAMGDRAAEKTAIQEYANRYPNDPRLEPILAELVQLYSQDGQDRDAITASTRYIKQFPTGASRNDVIYVMGDSGLKIGNCALAIQSFQALDSLKYRDASARLKEAKANCK